MKVLLTKWFISATVLAVILVLAIPSTSCGFSSRIVLADDPNEPQPEIAPFEDGKTYLDDEPDEPEAWLSFGQGILLVSDSNEPEPECCPY